MIWDTEPAYKLKKLKIIQYLPKMRFKVQPVIEKGQKVQLNHKSWA